VQRVALSKGVGSAILRHTSDSPLARI